VEDDVTFFQLASRKLSAGNIAKSASVLMAIALVLFPEGLAAQQTAEPRSMIPIALWWIGSLVLGLGLAYGIWRNRSRTRADKQRTEQERFIQKRTAE
jgi:protein-S-isoprenylcysteine O-methyltransferase Ste14